MEMSRRRERDAWTYHQFGARSFQDDIRALVLDDLDQARDSVVLRAVMGEQAEAGLHPFVPIPTEKVDLLTKTTNPIRVGGVTRFLVPIDLEEHRDALLYLGQHPELLAKVRDRLAQEIAANLVNTILDSQRVSRGIDAVSMALQVGDASRPYREALSGSFSEAVRLNLGPARAPERAESDEQSKQDPQNDK